MNDMMIEDNSVFITYHSDLSHMQDNYPIYQQRCQAIIASAEKYIRMPQADFN
jgi:hypothetical protein